jgi:uncharacterized protein YndB with AHSA1/START domain
VSTDSITVSDLIPARPQQVWAAWLDGAAHEAMTGAAAEAEPRVGSRHSAWDGYITGENLELDPGRRIVQSWRTSEFPAGAGDSRLEVQLEAAGTATRITLKHSKIPKGQGIQYEQGWKDHYFEPMKAYFAKSKPKKK